MRVETRSLLRLAGQLAFAVQNTSNCSAELLLHVHARSTLNVHAQCAQIFGTLVNIIDYG